MRVVMIHGDDNLRRTVIVHDARVKVHLCQRVGNVIIVANAHAHHFAIAHLDVVESFGAGLAQAAQDDFHQVFADLYTLATGLSRQCFGRVFGFGVWVVEIQLVAFGFDVLVQRRDGFAEIVVLVVKRAFHGRAAHGALAATFAYTLLTQGVTTRRQHGCTKDVAAHWAHASIVNVF